MTSTDIVNKSIRETKKEDPKYWSKVLSQRAGKTNSGKRNLYAVGSIYESYSPQELELALLNARWYQYKSKSLSKNVKAFKCRLPGIKRIISLNKIPPNTKVILDDRKNTGFLSCIYVSNIKGVLVNSTILIVNFKGKNKNHVVTFHPGAPIKPSKINSSHQKGKSIFVKDAYKLGLRYAKLRMP